MRKVSRLRWSGFVLSPQATHGSKAVPGPRYQSAATVAQQYETEHSNQPPFKSLSRATQQKSLQPPSPPVKLAKTSAKLSALHARLSLSSRIPLATLARSLVDVSADPSPQFNNESLSILGKDLLSYYTSEYIICRYPRLPLVVAFAAMHAYVGPKTMAALVREWGVEDVAEPGSEVDHGLLQFKSLAPGTRIHEVMTPLHINRAKGEATGYRRGMSSRTVYDDEFGELRAREDPTASEEGGTVGKSLEQASLTFVRALMGAIYLHCGRSSAKQFFREHISSRHLVVSDLFNFRQPTRDLSRLCAREGFQSPVARMISETGRKSRHPVFVVGIFSGKEKLGEASGSSLDEARTRASVASLKSWYLYSPPEVRVPSETEDGEAAPWKPVMVDPGDIVV